MKDLKTARTGRDWMNDLRPGDREEALRLIEVAPRKPDDFYDSLKEALGFSFKWAGIPYDHKSAQRWSNIHESIKNGTYFDQPVKQEEGPKNVPVEEITTKENQEPTYKFTAEELTDFVDFMIKVYNPAEHSVRFIYTAWWALKEAGDDKTVLFREIENFVERNARFDLIEIMSKLYRS